MKTRKKNICHNKEEEIRETARRILDIIAEDPDKFWEASRKLSEGLSMVSSFVKHNPKEAQKFVRDTAIKAIAKTIRKKI